MSIVRLSNPQDPFLEHMSWTQGWRLGSEVMLSGMTPEHGERWSSKPFLPTDGQSLAMYEQTLIIFKKIESWLEGAGGHRHNLIKTVIYVTDVSLKAEVGRARRDFFGSHFPLSTLVEVRALVSKDWLVEIDAWARLDVDIRQAQSH
jgi:enamine deaminase RidA (YjgF/YER057c/UK114 family)